MRERGSSVRHLTISNTDRMLVALVRALARGCRVLLLDEATSSVDPETDAIIQNVIQTKFADVTVRSSIHLDPEKH